MKIILPKAIKKLRLLEIKNGNQYRGPGAIISVERNEVEMTTADSMEIDFTRDIDANTYVLFKWFIKSLFGVKEIKL